MHAHEKIEVKNLTESRRWLWHNGHMRYELSVEERAHRVAEYARQVATYGEIVAYLPPVKPRIHDHRSMVAIDGDDLQSQR